MPRMNTIKEYSRGCKLYVTENLIDERTRMHRNIKKKNPSTFMKIGTKKRAHERIYHRFSKREDSFVRRRFISEIASLWLHRARCSRWWARRLCRYLFIFFFLPSGVPSLTVTVFFIHDWFDETYFLLLFVKQCSLLWKQCIDVLIHQIVWIFQRKTSEKWIGAIKAWFVN